MFEEERGDPGPDSPAQLCGADDTGHADNEHVLEVGSRDSHVFSKGPKYHTWHYCVS